LILEVEIRVKEAEEPGDVVCDGEDEDEGGW
jgi:hypothetical protein